MNPGPLVAGALGWWMCLMILAGTTRHRRFAVICGRREPSSARSWLDSAFCYVGLAGASLLMAAGFPNVHTWVVAFVTAATASMLIALAYAATSVLVERR